MRLRFASLFATALAAAFVAGVAGCGGNDDNAPPQPGGNIAQIRVIDAAPGAPPFDSYINGTQFAAGTGFGNQTGFASILSGPARLQLTPTGQPATNSFIDVLAPLAPGLRYTSVLIGDSTQSSGPDRLQTVLIEDGGAPPGSGNVKLRVVHGVPGVGPVDVFVTDPGAALPPTPTFANVGYATVQPASATPARELGSGQYRIRVRPTNQQNVVFDSGTITLNPDSDVIAVAVRDVAPGPTSSSIALLVVPSTGTGALVRDNRASLRVGNLSANMAPVDVFLKSSGTPNDPSNRIASGLAYPNTSAYIPFASGTYDLSAALVNSLNGVADLNGLVINRGSSVSAFVIGLVNGPGGQSPIIKAYVDDRAPVAGQAKVRVIHLVADAPPVDVVTLNNGAIDQRLVTNLSYADATATPLTLPPGTYTLAIVPTGATTPLLPTGGVSVTLAAGDVKTVVATGALAPNATNPVAQPLNLLVLDDR